MIIHTWSRRIRASKPITSQYMYSQVRRRIAHLPKTITSNSKLSQLETGGGLTAIPKAPGTKRLNEENGCAAHGDETSRTWASPDSGGKGRFSPITTLSLNSKSQLHSLSCSLTPPYRSGRSYRNLTLPITAAFPHNPWHYGRPRRDLATYPAPSTIYRLGTRPKDSTFDLKCLFAFTVIGRTSGCTLTGLCGCRRTLECSLQLTCHVLALHDLIVDSGVNVLLIGRAGLELRRALSTPGNASSPFASRMDLYICFWEVRSLDPGLRHCD
ncbi:hypothetical protein EV421DRAFT_722904 [Armillaria borealis]|uniref:Uncharacterized protein n=1 Tax=Armillaria borealis TaxID=47425 RepID=A0AA39N1E9_9AGAR|nr:hypothetical protein EV421DRAFT_722904 [Armillaria borealis]